MHPALRKEPLIYKTPPIFHFFTKKPIFHFFYKKTRPPFHFRLSLFLLYFYLRGE